MVKDQKYLEEKRKETGLFLFHSESIRLEYLTYIWHMYISGNISNFSPIWRFNKLPRLTKFEEKYACKSCQTLEVKDSHTLSNLGHYTAEYEIKCKMNNYE